jgi:hypothetical protein
MSYLYRGMPLNTQSSYQLDITENTAHHRKKISRNKKNNRKWKNRLLLIKKARLMLILTDNGGTPVEDQKQRTVAQLRTYGSPRIGKSTSLKLFP